MHDEHLDEIERIVLLRLLEPPQSYHVRDLARELHEDQEEVEAASMRLLAARLAELDGNFVSPSKPAIRFNELLPVSI